MGDFARKADGRRIFTVEFKRGIVQQLVRGKIGRAGSRPRLRNKTRSSRPVWRMMTCHPAAWAPASAARISGSPVTASLA